MKSDLYLHQSRRLAIIIRLLIGKSYWTNYSAWEYKFNNIELNLAYTNDWNCMRFIFVNNNSRKTLFKTNSIKEAVNYIKNNINK